MLSPFRITTKEMPKNFPKTDEVWIRFEVTVSNSSSIELLTPSPKESFIVRLLADGMDNHAVLHRMYGEEFAGESFPNAEDIVWIIHSKAFADETIAL